MQSRLPKCISKLALTQRAQTMIRFACTWIPCPFSINKEVLHPNAATRQSYNMATIPNVKRLRGTEYDQAELLCMLVTSAWYVARLLAEVACHKSPVTAC